MHIDAGIRGHGQSSAKPGQARASANTGVQRCGRGLELRKGTSMATTQPCCQMWLPMIDRFSAIVLACTLSTSMRWLKLSRVGCIEPACSNELY